MNHSGQSLDELFAHYSGRGEPLVLATVVHTIGSTYRKPGAQMLIAGDGRSAGLLSGGCLEADLFERARMVLESGRAMLVDYDSRGTDDVLWGIGLGCEGAMQILLSRLSQDEAYEPYAFEARCRNEDRQGAFALVIDSRNSEFPLGAAFDSEHGTSAPLEVQAALARSVSSSPREGQGVMPIETRAATFLVVPVAVPLRLLVLGAGPDAIPLVEIAGLLDWHVTVFDHRPAYAVAERFARARRVAVNPAVALAEELGHARYDAAVVMSHHLSSDEHYLRALAPSDVPYVGLLGPAPRRARLIHELGSNARALEGRLFGPVGLDIGATTPEAIALAIVAEIQAVRAGRGGGSFSQGTLLNLRSVPSL
jgi:xanthine dehydrogenase accessory factor